MPFIQFEKYVTSLPAILTKNTLYFVKNGAGFDIHLTNDTGTVVAYPLNTGSGGGGLTGYSFSVDFGSNWKPTAQTTVSNANISPSSKIIAFLSSIGSSRSQDELEFERVEVACIPGTGEMNVIAKAEDVARGIYNFNYIIL